MTFIKDKQLELMKNQYSTEDIERQLVENKQHASQCFLQSGLSCIRAIQLGNGLRLTSHPTGGCLSLNNVVAASNFSHEFSFEHFLSEARLFIDNNFLNALSGSPNLFRVRFLNLSKNMFISDVGFTAIVWSYYAVNVEAIDVSKTRITEEGIT